MNKNEAISDVDKAAIRYTAESYYELMAPGDLANAFLAGAEWMQERILSIINSRISEILGDAQPRPVLRAELRELMNKIKENASESDH